MIKVYHQRNDRDAVTRICPGKALGDASVFILIATLLSIFDIAPPPHGMEDIQFESQLVR